jgi:REP element-mobilizing transposase RayT
MARMGRVEFEGAVYHVLCRGDRREAIFQSERDREIFLETLGEVSERNGWRVHAYVLMSNHYHLLGWRHRKPIWCEGCSGSRRPTRSGTTGGIS